VIDRVTVSKDPAAAASYAELVLDSLTDLQAIGVTVTAQLPRVNALNPDLIAAGTFQSTGGVFFTGSRATVLNGDGIAACILAAGANYDFLGPFTLCPGAAMGAWQILVNARWDVTWRGRYFPGVSEIKGR
jgi:hypothetical protein